MPWTFAHPAAILPLRRLCPRWLSLPGLVIGSLTPDLGYYGGQLSLASFSHTPLGIAVCCLPLGLLLLALLLRLRRPLTVLLPTPHRQLIRSHIGSPARLVAVKVLIAAQSIALGATSHVLWDSFTHGGHWGVSLLPFLSLHVFDAGNRQIYVFNVLQHLSTVMGLAAMTVTYRRAIRATASSASLPELDTRRIRLLLAGLACSITVGLLAAVALDAMSPGSPSLFVVRTTVWSTTCFAALYLLGSIAWWRRLGDG
ncbi:MULTISPECIES: DUF4184 family protein [unclassified Roseateles]|uniref:DUF4184 family protein n=1 Tax=unclassified Roseateles TaxID=2626991 RepID=UPI0006FE080C|nr:MULTISPECIES: DUF4184 family protein [unclassified Roseateles]KQW46554.1 hypothetical protein ASC81_09145 [Pelomonas sp. Root405]KRA73605.1 hypothetical protein ASD88_09145 [Pelomonas sp. Root662]